MKEYSWVKVNHAISKWLDNYEDHQLDLLGILVEINANNGLDDKLNGSTVALKEIDPFTFFSALIKFGTEKRLKLFADLLNKINLEVLPPKDFDGCPSVEGRNFKLFPSADLRQPYMIEKLWELFHQAGEENIDPKTFKQVLEIPKVGFTKLTQSLFHAYPEYYFPIDSQTKPWLSKHGIEIPNEDFESYSRCLQAIKKDFNVPYAELSYKAFLGNQQAEFSAEAADRYLTDRFAGARTSTSHIVAFKTPDLRELAFDPGSNPSNKKKIKVFVDALPPMHIASNSEKYDAARTRNHHLSTHAPSLAQGKSAWSPEITSLEQLIELCDWYEDAVMEKPVMKENIVTTESKLPMNQILYGPPGTGKTYLTSELAVKIADPQWYSEIQGLDYDVATLRNEVKARYQLLVDKQRIMFTTFHQSFSYEDFIEGIRANTDESGIRYDVVDGIFKQLCTNAVVRVQSGVAEDISLSGRRIWKMSLGNTLIAEDFIYEECLDQNYVLLGYGDDINFSHCDTRAAVKEHLEKIKTIRIDANDYTLTAVNTFKNLMKKGDLIVVSDGNHKFRAIAEITGDYEFLHSDERIGFQQLRRVKWLREYNPSLPKERLFIKALSQMTVYELRPATIDHGKLAQLLAPVENQESTHLPHVLIIDEINRGNISRIFGELITLLEPSKRIGASDAQSTVLPYSKDSFSVPNNVYVIGTMNTADKSLAQLDLALRRRFSFVEMPPDPSLLRGTEVYGVDLADMLQMINLRIEALLDSDHMIGHAYFIQLLSAADAKAREEQLTEIFRDKILPLLREYFFDDYERIGWVLNDPIKKHDDRFVLLQDSSSLLPLTRLFTDDVSGTLLDRRYRINPIALYSAAAYQGIVA